MCEFVSVGLEPAGREEQKSFYISIILSCFRFVHQPYNHQRNQPVDFLLCNSDHSESKVLTEHSDKSAERSSLFKAKFLL